MKKYRKPIKSDFQFLQSGHGHYKVTYFSPTTNKKWIKVISDMGLVDDVKNNDTPTKSRMHDLIRTIKY